MSKTYAILGGGGSFGIHAAFYLLDHANPNKVIGIGRNPLRPEPFSLGIQDRAGYDEHRRQAAKQRIHLRQVAAAIGLRQGYVINRVNDYRRDEHRPARRQRQRKNE